MDGIVSVGHGVCQSLNCTSQGLVTDSPLALVPVADIRDLTFLYQCVTDMMPLLYYVVVTGATSSHSVFQLCRRVDWLVMNFNSFFVHRTLRVS